MSPELSLLLIVASPLVGAVSPGPSFLVIGPTARQGRGKAVLDRAAALMGTRIRRAAVMAP